MNTQGQQIYDLISDDLMKSLIMPTPEQEDEVGRQKALLDTDWFFEQLFKEGEEKQKEMRSQIRPVLKDNCFKFRINFTNLSDEELGMLIWGLELHGDLCHKIGMGKAIGFGSVQIEITESHIESDHTPKYTAFELPVDEKGELKKNPVNKYKYLKSFFGWMEKRTQKKFHHLENVKALSTILDFNKGNTNRFYPTGEGFRDYGRLKGEALPVVNI